MTVPPTGHVRVLMLSRSYPSDVFPNLGLWVERPTALMNRRTDIEVRVLSPQPYCPPLPRLASLRQYWRFRQIRPSEQLNGVEVIRPRYLGGPGRSTYAIESRSYALGLRRPLDRLRERFPFDIVHAHFIYPEGAVAHRLSRRYGVPFVISEHAPWTSEWFASRAVRRASLTAARAVSALMPVSDYIGRSIADWVGDQTPLSIVPEGVEGEMFRPSDRSAYDADRVLFVGWPTYNKGVDVLLRAVEIMKRKDAPGRLLLVGGSYYRATRRMEQELRELAAALDLGDRVTFAGPKSHAEVARLMAESAVVVLPSRFEAFGTVLAEALACGTPVVATRCGGPEDYVTPDVGRLVPVGDPEALADALVAVLRGRERFASDALRRYALERFSWSRVVDGWLDAYEKALGRPLRADEAPAWRVATSRS